MNLLSIVSHRNSSMKPLRHRPLALAVFCAALTLSSLLPSVHAANEKPPAKMTFQGFLTDTDGTPLGNTAPETKVVQFKIYDASTGGTLLRTEEQTVTLDKGHFSVLLGEGTVSGTVPTLPAIFQSASASDRFLELVVDGSAMTPRIQFVASPYALLAGSANQLIDAAGNAVLIPTVGGLTVTGTLSATTGFSGNGSALTALNGANINAGTVADSKLATISTAGKVDVSAITGSLADSKLATITTAGKVANSATTATSANTANAIVARDASGNFTAGTVTAGNVTVGGKNVATGDSAFRIIAGIVNANGTLSQGTGFTCQKNNFNGYYSVTLTGVSATPIVTLTPVGGDKQIIAASASLFQAYVGGFQLFTKL
ncbi:MAG: hypothetical protein RIS76_916, partial [Verrucomicrobiota bacterium]